MPVISIITPVYQAEHFLSACVESVKQQTFSDWELLLIDDGSTDSSPMLCERFAAEDKRIKVFHQEKNAGVSEARNRGLKEAKGDFIAFIDADDCFIPQTLETLWNLHTQSGAETVGCAHWNVMANGQEDIELLLPTGIYDKEQLYNKFILPLFSERLRTPILNGYIWRFLFSSHWVQNIRFDGAYLEDELFLLDYFCKIYKNANTTSPCLAVTDKPLYRYFQNNASATRHYMENLMDVLTEYMDKKETLAEKYHLSSVCPNWRENSNWAGLLIAVGNEYAHGNSKTLREREETVKAICRRPEMVQAIERLKPEGMGRNKQLVSFLLRHRWFRLLSLLYKFKNHI